jgi:glycine/D-amino acid oxidase-like deaminating enzyme
VLRSLWLDDDGDRRFASAALAGAPAVEIVGAGVTGLSCALTLAQAGVAVRVHDARGVAGGASGRNAGFALRGAAIPYDEAQAVLGATAARELWALSEAALVRLESLAGDAFRPEGSLRLAVDAAERRRIRAEYEALVADGFAAEWREPPAGGCGGRFRGALFHPTDGAIQPLRWIRRLAAATLAAGADIVEGSRVGRLGELVAPHVVVATDGYGSGLLPGLDAVIVPARGQVIATAPLWPRTVVCPHYARDGYDYWQQLPDGRLVVGGARDTDRAGEATSDEGVTPAIQARLEELAAAVLGEVPRITHRWSGAWGETPDRLPLVGRLDDALAERLAGRSGVWIAAGYSGHGNVLGLACGELVARGILGEPTPELVAFDPARLLGGAPLRG